MSPCTSPAESVGSGSTHAVGSHHSQTIAVNSANTFPPVPQISVNANGTLRAKEHVLTNSIPGPESCV